MTQRLTEHHLSAGTSGSAPFSVAVTPESADWSASSLWVLTVAPGQQVDLDSGRDEIMVLPLSGSATVASAGTRFHLAGRASVFHGPSDFAYVGIDSQYSVHSEAGGRFALCGARAETTLPFRYVAAAEVAVELRGAGSCSRQVHNFGTADTFEADSLIACEVITPGGNWSSYAPTGGAVTPAHFQVLDTRDTLLAPYPVRWESWSMVSQNELEFIVPSGLAECQAERVHLTELADEVRVGIEVGSKAEPGPPCEA